MKRSIDQSRDQSPDRSQRPVPGRVGERTNGNGAVQSAAADSWPHALVRDPAAWQAAREAATGGPKILVTNAFGVDPSVAHFDSMVAAALTLRGADVQVLACDKSLSACWTMESGDSLTAEAFARSGPPARMCERCLAGSSSVFTPLGLPLHHQGQLVTPEEARSAQELSAAVPLDAILDYRLDGVAVGEHAFAGAVRFLGRGDIDAPGGEGVLRRYLAAAIESLHAIRKLRERFRFDCLVTLHGIYVPEGVFCEFARQQNARVVNWAFTYRKRTCTLSHGDSYERTLQLEPTSVWENIAWTPETEFRIVDYLNSRRVGTRDWHRLVENPQEDFDSIRCEIGADLSKPYALMLTNVVWDARVFYQSNAFSNMMEWVLETIAHFAKRSQMQLIIRVHPGELLATNQARQTVMGEIARAFPELPPNVFTVLPESSISTYVLAERSNATLIYGTTAGMEVAAMGIPVVVAGDAAVKNKGFTLDASSKEEYFRSLEQLPFEERMSASQTRRARMYAFHYFFRRMVPLPFNGSAPARAEIGSLEELLPGRHVGLDIVCDGILSGSEFVYPAERHAIAADAHARPDSTVMARETFRVADRLGRIGEIERTRRHLLKALAGSPSLVRDPHVTRLISNNLVRLALASEDPLSAVRRFGDEARARVRASGWERRFTLRRAMSGALVEVAVASWKRRDYRVAFSAALRAAGFDPLQLVQASHVKRLGRFLSPSRPTPLERSKFRAS